MLLAYLWLGVLISAIGFCVVLYKHYLKVSRHVESAPLTPQVISTPNISNELSVNNKTIPLSVNYHFTRRCNYECSFCFHTDTNSYIAPLDDAKAGLLRLSQAGMKKVNFAGGEPFLYASMLGKMVDYCKQDLKVESVSIVSNGSKITEGWIRAHAANLDILAISCDSFDETTNIKIGRGKGTHISQLFRVAGWCREYGVLFKLNSVICTYNHDEDMNRHITALQPYRWKCFQVLLVAGENDSSSSTMDKTKRDARGLQISDAEFERFCARHAAQKSIVPESNRVMAKSYLILDEQLRFLDRTGKRPSASILQVGVERALGSVFWDMDGFKERGGVYAWNEDLVQTLNGSETGEEKIMGGGGCGADGSGGGALVDMEDIGKKTKKD